MEYQKQWDLLKDLKNCNKPGLKNKFNRNKGPDIPKGNTIIELKNVSFKYPNSDDYILHNLNLQNPI